MQTEIRGTQSHSSLAATSLALSLSHTRLALPSSRRLLRLEKQLRGALSRCFGLFVPLPAPAPAARGAGRAAREASKLRSAVRRN